MRRWVTREEIAEIHDALADRLFLESMVAPGSPMPLLLRAFAHDGFAKELRATEALAVHMGRAAITRAMLDAPPPRPPLAAVDADYSWGNYWRFDEKDD